MSSDLRDDSLDLPSPGGIKPYDEWNEHGLQPFVVVCDHGGTAIPTWARPGPSHEPFCEPCDAGAAQLAKRLASALQAPAVLQCNSKLVVDCARPPNHVQFIRGGDTLAGDEAAKREREIVQPYYEAIRTQVARLLQNCRGVRHILVISVHTIDDDRVKDGTVLLAEASWPGLSARARALAALRDELSKVLGTSASGGPLFAGEHLALFEQDARFRTAGGTASSITLKVARNQATKPHIVDLLGNALSETSKAANRRWLSFQSGRLLRKSGKLALGWAGLTAVISLLVASPKLVDAVTSLQSRFMPHYMLVVDRQPASITDVLLDSSLTIRLGRVNPADKTVSYPEAFSCAPNGKIGFLQNVVSRGTEDGCTFKVNGSRTLFATSSAPRSVAFAVDVIDENQKAVAVPFTTLIFHDFAPPTPVVLVESVEAGEQFVVTLAPFSGGEAVTYAACNWLPAQYVVKSETVASGCQATFVAPPSPGPTKALHLFVRATATSSTRSFVVSSNDVVVPITPRQHHPAMAVPEAAHQSAIANTTPTPAPMEPTLSSSATRSTPSAPSPGPTKSAVIMSAGTASGVIELAGALRDTRDNDRYLLLREGLATLDPASRLTPEDALRLLGPLSGNLRARALTNWMLPRIAMPMSAADGERLIASLEPFDRVELLHDLGGCVLAPLTDQQQAQLLSGIFGVARERATTALTTRGGDCGKAITNGG